MKRAIVCLTLLAVLGACEREPALKTAPAPTAPPETSLWSGVSTEADLTTFTNALQVAGVEPTLRSSGPYTVFAPTNAAFALMPVIEREPLLQSQNVSELRMLLTYHIVPGRLTAADLAQRATQAGGQFELTTMQGDPLKIAFTDGRLTITDGAGHAAMILEPDQAAPNGVLHTVDSVLRRRRRRPDGFQRTGRRPIPGGLMALNITLNPNLDRRALADAYRRDGMIQIPEFFAPETAEALGRILEGDLPWERALFGADQRPAYLSQAELDGMGLPALQAQTNALLDRAGSSYGFMYDSFRLITAWLNKSLPGHPGA